MSSSAALQIASRLRRERHPITLLTGYFDVLQPALVRRLHDVASTGFTLFAIVLNPPAPLLSAQARSELAAALRVIDYVICLDGDPADLIDQLQPDTCIRDEKAHIESTEQLIEHVLERHGRALAGRHDH